MKHYDVAKEFAQGTDKVKGSRMFVEDNTIYSYGRHFPIAVRFKPNIYLFNSQEYSTSTSKHKNYVRHALSGSTLIELPSCNPESADQQLTTNTSKIITELQKLKRARTQKQQHTNRINHLLKQNQLIKQHIQNTTQPNINIKELVEQNKNNLTEETYQQLKTIIQEMVLDAL